MAFPLRGRLALLGALGIAGAIIGAGGCGARGTLDTIVIEKVYVEASTDASVVDAGHDAASDSTSDGPDAEVDAPADTEPEASGFDGGPVINCATCLGQNCGTQLITCVTNTACRTALQCVGQTCLTGGAPSLQCFGNCTGGNAMTQQDVLQVVSCVLTSCSECTGLLAGLGGTTTDAGGGGGGSRD